MMYQAKFNEATGGGGGGSADRNRAARMRSMGSRVIEYANIEREFANNPEEGQKLKERMDALMDPIDNAPADLDLIFKFGTEPLKDLRKVADGVLDINSKLGAQVKVMEAAKAKADKGLDKDKIKQLTTGLRHMVANGKELAKDAAATGILGGVRVTKKVANFFTGREKKRTEEEAHVAAMIDSIPQMYADMQTAATDLKNAEGDIQGIIDAAVKLGKARVELVRELNVYLGAASEVLRRYDQVYIVEAKEGLEAGTQEAQVYLTDIMNARDKFHERYSKLEQSATHAIVAARLLQDTIEQLNKQREMIREFSTVRETEWTALMADAGLSAATLRIQAMLTKSDETGDMIHDAAIEMQEKSHELMKQSEGRGTIDPAKTLAALERMQKILEEDAEAKHQRYLDAESNRQQLRAAAENYLDAVQKIQTDRILEAAPETEKASAAPTSRPKAAANDDAPQAAKPQAASKPTGTSGPGPT